MVAGEPVRSRRGGQYGLRAETVTIRSTSGKERNGPAYGCDLTEGYVRFNAEYTT